MFATAMKYSEWLHEPISLMPKQNMLKKVNEAPPFQIEMSVLPGQILSRKEIGMCIAFILIIEFILRAQFLPILQH